MRVYDTSLRAPTEISGQADELRPCSCHEGTDSRFGDLQWVHGLVELSRHVSSRRRAEIPMRFLQDTVWGRLAAIGIGLAGDREAGPSCCAVASVCTSTEHSGNLAEATLGQPPFALSAVQWRAAQRAARPCRTRLWIARVPPSSQFPVFPPLVPGGTPFIQGKNPNIKDGKTYEYNMNVQYEVGPQLFAASGIRGNTVGASAGIDCNSTSRRLPVRRIRSTEKRRTPSAT